MKNKNPKAPWIIVFVALLLLIALVFLGNLSFKATEKATFDEFNQRQLALARSAASGIELYFETLAGDLRALGLMPEVQNFDETLTRRTLQHTFEKLEPLGVNDIGVLDADGVLRYNVMAPQIEGVDFSWRGYFQQAQEIVSNDTYVTEFIEFKGVEAGRKGVLIAVPLFKVSNAASSPSPSSEFAGVVVGTLTLDTIIQKFVIPIQSSERGHAFLVGDEHTVLWAPDDSLFGKNLLEQGQGFPTFQSTVERMSAGVAGVTAYSFYKFDDAAGRYNPDVKEEKLIAYTPIQLGDQAWSIGVWAPKKDARQLIQSAYVRLLLMVGLGIATILVGSVYALTLSFRTTRSLEREVQAQAGELKESHERLITVLDSLDAYVHVADIETGEILFVNKRLQNLWGDVVGKIHWQVLQAGQPGPCAPCPDDKLLSASGEAIGVYGWEFQAPATGNWYEIRDRAIRWVDGRTVRLEIALDVTERKSAEDALRESEERYRRLVELSPHAIAIQRQDKIVFINPAGAELFGAENPGQLAGKSVWDFVLPENGEVVQARYRQMYEHKTSVPPIEQEFVRLDGKHIDVEVIATPFTYAGKPAIQAVFRDITERKRAEEALQATYAFQQSIIDGVAEPIMVVGADYQIKLMNQAAREFSLGVTDDKGPLFCYQVFHQGDAPCQGLHHPCPMEPVRESGRPVTVIHEHHRANGERRLVEVIAAPLWGADGTFQGIIEAVRDVTEHKWVEEKLKRQTRALVHSDDELGQFAHKVIKSIQDFFEKLPSE